MTIRTDTVDMGALRLTSGEGRHLELGLVIEPLELGADTYIVTPAHADLPETVGDQIPGKLDISRMVGSGYALHIGFRAALHGPCMRCLEPAAPEFRVDARDVHQPGEGDDELESPYVVESILDVGAWARDSLVLALPPALLCQPDCLGLCAVCGENLNTAGPEHVHESERDPRWAALAELTFPDEEPASAGDEAPEAC